MQHIKTHRPAIAMIELIFAIVIMGIVLMSAPMLISTATKSGYVAIQQEGINEAASRVNMIISDYSWDEQNTDDNASYTIMQTSNVNVDLDEFSSVIFPGFRRGTPKESYRNFRLDSSRLDATAQGSLGDDSGDSDDIDDFIGDTNLTLEGTGTGANYVETTTINIATVVKYNQDAVTGGTYQANNIIYNPFNTTSGTAHIKEITTTLTSTSGVDELNKTIILRAFSCNIGGYKLEEKDF